ncbi:hypothetical protein GGTG_06932 [Gaeumannomyces tritici R3-111a-1]|uniref:Uncharacterized protein n=1 Tax=Gaeumannomyces tritici (strain R3-111a-1) TaxID=644352 RepID=J3P085_GAET3|nr:hypothetical protein GGTG_06932 [Gaeumannomyces tritici R3-111a-1]EJT77018.1 hypothetical protein GGTG_06932 [Gaeumannomyces tritici R3-111a-1]
MELWGPFNSTRRLSCRRNSQRSGHELEPTEYASGASFRSSEQHDGRAAQLPLPASLTAARLDFTIRQAPGTLDARLPPTTQRARKDLATPHERTPRLLSSVRFHVQQELLPLAAPARPRAFGDDTYPPDPWASPPAGPSIFPRRNTAQGFSSVYFDVPLTRPRADVILAQASPPSSRYAVLQ